MDSPRITLSPNRPSKPVYCTPIPVPNIPENNQVSVIDYRFSQIATFTVDGRQLICLPQAFELFLKHLVGGLHTVYTKLKRLEITPVVCNVEQVRILRGLGAIQPGVNRCKLIAPKEFDVLFNDCTNSSARPGRPSKRASVMPSEINDNESTRLARYGFVNDVDDDIKILHFQQAGVFNFGFGAMIPPGVNSYMMKLISKSQFRATKEPLVNSSFVKQRYGCSKIQRLSPPLITSREETPRRSAFPRAAGPQNGCKESHHINVVDSKSKNQIFSIASLVEEPQLNVFKDCNIIQDIYDPPFLGHSKPEKTNITDYKDQDELAARVLQNQLKDISDMNNSPYFCRRLREFWLSKINLDFSLSQSVSNRTIIDYRSCFNSAPNLKHIVQIPTCLLVPKTDV